jgi:hypothetical protein
MTTINYIEQTRPQKRQIVSFIRKQLNGADVRDIIRGLHKAILKDGKLTGVATDLSMIYNEARK